MQNDHVGRQRELHGVAETAESVKTLLEILVKADQADDGATDGDRTAAAAADEQSHEDGRAADNDERRRLPASRAAGPRHPGIGLRCRCIRVPYADACSADRGP